MAALSMWPVPTRLFRRVSRQYTLTLPSASTWCRDDTTVLVGFGFRTWNRRMLFAKRPTSALVVVHVYQTARVGLSCRRSAGEGQDKLPCQDIFADICESNASEARGGSRGRNRNGRGEVILRRPGFPMLDRCFFVLGEEWLGRDSLGQGREKGLDGRAGSRAT